MYKQNLHTHTNFCDGADSPEEMVLYAMEKGFSSIGFSGHSYMNYSNYMAQTADKTEDYKKEVKRLKEKYKEQIEVFLGLEVDMYSKLDMSEYDYLIGSVHYFKIGEEYVGFDRDAKTVKQVIDEYFGGNGMEYAKAYYKAVGELPKYGNFDIIGHFDLITKHFDKENFFDITSKEYKNAVFEAIEELSGKIPFFEVNTGAIARGYRKTPYPMPDIIKEFKRRGFGAVITSDCHEKTMLECKFDEAAKLLKACGYKEKYILTKEGFSAVAV